MAKILKCWDRFSGISDFRDESIVADAFYFGRSIDVRTSPKEVSILPRTVKESGNVVTDLIKWADVYHPDSEIYMYGDDGNFYKRTSTRAYTLLTTIPGSHGNGLCYNPEDDFIYYTTDKVIGRYGKMSATSPQFTNDFLGAQGGVPLNTNSISLVAASSQYAYRADTASLSITSDLAIEAQINPTTLPTVGNTMTIAAKWNGDGNIRSYKFDIACVSGYFGDGSDGALTISSNTTGAPVDSACTGTTGTSSLTATNASFAANQIILIHQSRGTGAGTWQRNTIASYTAGTITTLNALNATYSTGAQVRVLKQYTNVTVNTGITYTAKAWSGTVGGILAFLASGTVTVTGTISASGKGFVGGTTRTGSNIFGYCGEGTGGASAIKTSGAANGNGGGSAWTAADGNYSSGGNGGGNGAAGTGGEFYTTDGAVTPGTASGSADLTAMTFGGGGSGAVRTSDTGVGAGGAGGGIVFITGATITVTGSIVSLGVAGTNAQVAGGGGGAGGSILLKAQVATLGSSLVTATGGAGGVGTDRCDGGAGAVGRIHLDYYTSYTGTTSPTLNVVQDDSLVTNTSYQLRLAVSNDGTAYETLAREANLQTSVWQQVGVSWDASASEATFILNGVSLGTDTGALTAISNNASEFFVGCNKNDAGTAANFYNGLMDEVRVYNAVRTAAQFLGDMSAQIATNTVSLVAYYKFNGDVTDDQASGLNDLTASGSPTYSTNVPFSSPTTRLDIDQSATTTGQTYALATTIAETATHRKSFTPAKDPQKSIAVLVAAVGTGNWTLTVHDALNNEVASKTIAVASMATGYQEFTFSSVWRPITNFTEEYHFHLTSTVADGTVTTTDANDLETVSYRTHYQFLVEDTSWHAICRFLNFIVILNERYLAKYEATLYEPNKVVFGAGWKARCYGYWQDYLAIGCTRGSNIYDYDQGRIYLWDGYSPTWNDVIEVPQGGVNALYGVGGQLFMVAGWHADLLVYEGGRKVKKLKELPLLSASEYAEVYPQALSMWQSYLRYGVGPSDSTTMNRAVYTWGAKNSDYPDTLTCDYPVSTGNYLDTVKIGMILPFNKELLVSWQDNVACGVDYVAVGNAPYPAAYLEMMVDDLDVPYKEKTATKLVATFDPLVSGESINVKYMNEEGDTSWNTNSESPSADDISITKIIANGRYYNMRVAVDLTTSVSTSPTLKSVVLERDGNEGEEVLG